ncbi:hypothetical protein ILUMI_22052, partial [Ignelater luminosus]
MNGIRKEIELEQATMNHFKDTVARCRDRRYQVSLPWVEGHLPLPTNRNLAERKLQATTGKLVKEQKILMDTINATNMETAELFKKEAQELLLPAKFNLRGWEFGPSAEKKMMSVLGMLWDTWEDCLKIALKNLKKQVDRPATKRMLLSVANMVFDPLGLVCPVALRPRILIKKAYNNKMKLGWDDSLPEQIAKEVEGKEVTVQLVQAKSRITPKKCTSIPRLVRLAKTVRNHLMCEDIRTYLWSDSTVTLAWIQNDGIWGTFVTNQVKKIRQLTGISQWRHVRGELSPTDLPSRSCSAKQLITDQCFSTRPATSKFGKKEDFSVCHERLHKALCGRWYAKVLKLSQDEKHCSGLDDSRIKKLRLFKNDQGLLCIKTKLIFGMDEDNVKCPIVLPDNSNIVKLMILKEHQTSSHAGVQVLQSGLRERLWILNSRHTIGNVICKCATCCRFNATRCEIEEALLSVNRIKNAEAFEVTGVDLVGPLILRGGQKVWIVLYICAVYHAQDMDAHLLFTQYNNVFKKIDWKQFYRYSTVNRIDWRFNFTSAAWWGGFWERPVGL